MLVEKGVIGYWLLFRSFSDYGFTQFNGSGKCRGQLQATRGLGIPIHPSRLPRVYILPTSIIERILPSSRLGRLGMTLDQFWGCLSSYDVRNQTVRIHKLFKTLVLHGLLKNILSPSYLHELSRIKESSGLTIPLDVHAYKRVHECLRRFARAISVSA